MKRRAALDRRCRSRCHRMRPSTSGRTRARQSMTANDHGYISRLLRPARNIGVAALASGGAFIDRVAAPIADKVFEHGLVFRS